MSQQVESLESGFVLSDRYIVKRLLGRGGMGSVYLAQDTVLNSSDIALKVLHPEISENESHSKRFLREVELMRKINNPSVVRTYDVGIDKGLLYYAMEYVEGLPLEDLAKDKPISYHDLSEIIIKICEGLEAIHKEEVIHRDLKPANIMILEGNKVKITDFGVARNKNSDLTRSDEIIGSVVYIAPEIWLGQKITSSCDLYSLGVILYELLVGEPPFKDEEPATMMWYHIKQVPTPPKSIRESIPNWLNQLTLKLLSKKTESRPSSAREVIEFVERNKLVGRSTSKKQSSLYPREKAVAPRDRTPNSDRYRSGKKSRFGKFWISATVFSVLTVFGLVAYAYNFIVKFLYL